MEVEVNWKVGGMPPPTASPSRERLWLVHFMDVKCSPAPANKGFRMHFLFFRMNLQVMNVTSAQSFFMEWAKSVTKRGISWRRLPKISWKSSIRRARQRQGVKSLNAFASIGLSFAFPLSIAFIRVLYGTVTRVFPLLNDCPLEIWISTLKF